MRLIIPSHLKSDLQRASVDAGLEGSASALVARLAEAHLRRENSLAELKNAKAHRYPTRALELKGGAGDLEDLDRRLKAFARDRGVDEGHAARILLASALSNEVAP